MPENRSAGPNFNVSAFAADSIMSRRSNGADWSRSPVGRMSGWPAELKFAVRMVLKSVSPMAVLAGQEGTTIYNDAARQVFDLPHDRSLGKPISEIFPHAVEFFQQALAACHEGRGVRFYDHPIHLIRDGSWEKAWFSLSFTPIVDERENVLGAMVLASDVTERVQTLEELRRSRQRMELALEAGSIVGTWDLEVETGRCVLSGSLAQMFGLAGDDWQDAQVEVLARSIHDEDRARVLAALDRAIKKGSEFRCRCRLVTVEGGIHWLVALGTPVRDDNGKMLLMSGIVVDVTAVIETSTALQETNLRFDVLAETVPQIVWSTDGQGRHDYFSSRWSEFTGIAQEDITPDIWKALVHPDDWQRLDEVWQDCLATGKFYDIDYRFRYRDGTFRWLKVQAKPFRNDDGEITRWYGTATDIEEGKQLEIQRALVTREMDHRIKNLFALVNSLVSLSIRDEPALGPVAEPLRLRLAALHDAHALVHGTSSNAASLRELLEHLLEPYRSADPDHIVVKGDDVRLQSSAVTSMALAFHELISNSAKYGALAHTDGNLTVELRLEDERLTIHWVGRFAYDHVEAQSRMSSSGGFGTVLLKSVIERQLRGTFRREFVPEGTIIEMTFPISLLVPPENTH